MRTILGILLTCALGVLYFVENPELVRRLSAQGGALLHRLWYEQEVKIQGTSLIPTPLVTELLPTEKSNMWWHLNGEIISASLQTSPLIEGVQILRCGWSCFTLQIKERLPAFIAVVEDESKSWVVGKDGQFISPLTKEQFRSGALNAFGPYGKDLVVVKGLWRDSASADLLRARLLAAGEIIRTVQAETGVKIRSLNLVGSDELDIILVDIPFIVSIDLGVHGGPSLEEKAKRLRQVLKELEGRYEQVKKVDFAFNKMAVVTLK